MNEAREGYSPLILEMKVQPGLANLRSIMGTKDFQRNKTAPVIEITLDLSNLRHEEYRFAALWLKEFLESGTVEGKQVRKATIKARSEQRMWETNSLNSDVNFLQIG